VAATDCHSEGGEVQSDVWELTEVQEVRGVSVPRTFGNSLNTGSFRFIFVDNFFALGDKMEDETPQNHSSQETPQKPASQNRVVGNRWAAVT